MTVQSTERAMSSGGAHAYAGHDEVKKYIDPGADLGDALEALGRQCRGRGADAHHRAGKPSGAKAFGRAHGERALLLGQLCKRLRGVEIVGTARVSHDAVQGTHGAQRLADLQQQRGVGVNARAMAVAVDLDEYRQRPTVVPYGGGHRFGSCQRVDDNLNPAAALLQRHDLGQAVRRDADRIQNVLEACLKKGHGLLEGGDGNPGRACVLLGARHLHALRCLDMRAKDDPQLPHARGHTLDVVLHPVGVEQQRWGGQVGQGAHGRATGRLRAICRTLICEPGCIRCPSGEWRCRWR